MILFALYDIESDFVLSRLIEINVSVCPEGGTSAVVIGNNTVAASVIGPGGDETCDG